LITLKAPVIILRYHSQVFISLPEVHQSIARFIYFHPLIFPSPLLNSAITLPIISFIL